MKKFISAEEREHWTGETPDCETQCYWSDAYRTRVVEVLRFRARLLVETTYMFKHFPEYLRQKSSSEQKDKGEVYWTTEYYEKPIDQVRIIAAVENALKATLLEEGFMVHYMSNAAGIEDLFKAQHEKRPVRIEEFMKRRTFFQEGSRPPQLDGLGKEVKTLTISHLLKPGFTGIFKLDEQFVEYLGRIRSNRNRLHFLVDKPGAHEVSRYIKEWTLVRDNCAALTQATPSE